MARMRGALCLVLLAGAAVGARQAPPATRPRAVASVAAYTAELDALAASVRESPSGGRAEATRLIDGLPSEWIVTTTDRTWRVPAAGIRAALTDWQQQADAGHRAIVLRCLGLMRSEAQAVGLQSVDQSRSREALEDVLRAPEFSRLRTSSPFDRLRRRIAAWLFAVLERLFGSSLAPTVANVLIYGVIAAGVLAVALGAVRLLRRTTRAYARSLPPHEPRVARSWDDWLGEARTEAGRGNWTEAIHHSYWCAVAFLESRGAWRPDASRTPREYLALLPAGPDSSGLGVLTRLLERIWYGRVAADASTFDEALASLRSLGCPVA